MNCKNYFEERNERDVVAKQTAERFEALAHNETKLGMGDSLA